jgi:alpha-tubulin suppressor-like RCC1 family protein
LRFVENVHRWSQPRGLKHTHLLRLTAFCLVASSLSLGVLGIPQYYSCAVLKSGAIRCWGSNDQNQLGDGTASNRQTPVAAVGLDSDIAASIALGPYLSCAALTSGGVKCWGLNNFGQSGKSDHYSLSIPTDIPAFSGVLVSGIAMASMFSCFLLSSGAVKCAGYSGQTLYKVSTEVPGLSTGVLAIAAGYEHCCAILSGGCLRCWGKNDYGQLGDGTTASRYTPADVSGLSSGVMSLACGSYHSCAVLSSGLVRCWGRNTYGTIGDGTYNTRLTPVDVLSSASAVAAGNWNSCVILLGGAVKCWGFYGYGQVGNGEMTGAMKTTPVAVVGLTGVLSVAVGDNHVCAVRTGGSVSCWGQGRYGQVGDGTFNDRSTPTSVVIDSTLYLWSGGASQVKFITFGIASSDRVAHATSVPVTLTFFPSKPIPAGGTITLSYPSGFFASSVTPLMSSSNVVGLAVTCGATTATYIEITTSGAAIGAFQYFAMTLSGFTMGAATAGVVNVGVQTSTDTLLASSLVALTQVKSVVFGIASHERLAGKTSVPVTLTFTPSIPIQPGWVITLTYPSGFFAPLVTPVVYSGNSSVTGLKMTCGSTMVTSIAITVFGANIETSAFTVTISGFTMGSVTAGGVVSVQTTADQALSPAAPSGWIRDFGFSIASSDRVLTKSSVPVTLAFIPTTPISPGGTITLTYTSNFFVSSVTPFVAAGASSVAGLMATCGVTTATSVVITTSGATIGSTLFTVTISGFQLGGVTAGGNISIIFQTNGQLYTTSSVPTGVIGGQVFLSSFQCVLSPPLTGVSCDAIAQFKTSAGGALAVGSTITVNYPSNYFGIRDNFDTLTGSISTAGVALTPISTPGVSSIVITTTAASITGNTVVTITLLGLKAKDSTPSAGGPVSIQTSSDPIVSNVAQLGYIGYLVSLSGESFKLSNSDRVAGKTGVSATFSFKTSLGGEIVEGSTISFFWRDGFFATTLSKPNAAISIPGSTLTVFSFGDTCRMQYFGTAIPGGSNVIITLVGLTMGVAMNRDSENWQRRIGFQTARDQYWAYAESGSIGGAVDLSSFNIFNTSSLELGKSNVSVTLSFTTTAGGALAAGSTITLNYPLGYFDTSVTPNGSISTAGVALTPISAPGTTSIVITTSGLSIAASAFVTVTLSGLKMGSTFVGDGPVTIQTSSDQIASRAMQSGTIKGPSQASTAAAATSSAPSITSAAATTATTATTAALTSSAPSLTSTPSTSFGGTAEGTWSKSDMISSASPIEGTAVENMALFAGGWFCH